MNHVEVNTHSGRRVVTDLAATIDGMGVTKMLDGNGWTLTHIESGYHVGYLFQSSAAAEQALIETAEIVEWQGVVRGISEGLKPNTATEICLICEANGGVRDNASPVGTAAELRRRIAEAETSVNRAEQ